jgi:hypothetical protein
MASTATDDSYARNAIARAHRPSGLESPAAIARERRQEWCEIHRKHPERPEPRASRQPGPAKYDEHEEEGARQASAEIVDNLPAIDVAQYVRESVPARGRNSREEPRKQLPVAPEPSVHPQAYVA